MAAQLQIGSELKRAVVLRHLSSVSGSLVSTFTISAVVPLRSVLSVHGISCASEGGKVFIVGQRDPHFPGEVPPPTTLMCCSHVVSKSSASRSSVPPSSTHYEIVIDGSVDIHEHRLVSTKMKLVDGKELVIALTAAGALLVIEPIGMKVLQEIQPESSPYTCFVPSADNSDRVFVMTEDKKLHTLSLGVGDVFVGKLPNMQSADSLFESIPFDVPSLEAIHKSLTSWVPCNMVMSALQDDFVSTFSTKDGGKAWRYNQQTEDPISAALRRQQRVWSFDLSVSEPHVISALQIDYNHTCTQSAESNDDDNEVTFSLVKVVGSQEIEVVRACPIRPRDASGNSAASWLILSSRATIFSSLSRLRLRLTVKNGIVGNPPIQDFTVTALTYPSTSGLEGPLRDISPRMVLSASRFHSRLVKALDPTVSVSNELQSAVLSVLLWIQQRNLAEPRAEAAHAQSFKGDSQSEWVSALLGGAHARDAVSAEYSEECIAGFAGFLTALFFNATRHTALQIYSLFSSPLQSPAYAVLVSRALACVWLDLQSTPNAGAVPILYTLLGATLDALGATASQPLDPFFHAAKDSAGALTIAAWEALTQHADRLLVHPFNAIVPMHLTRGPLFDPPDDNLSFSYAYSFETQQIGFTLRGDHDTNCTSR